MASDFHFFHYPNNCPGNFYGDSFSSINPVEIAVIVGESLDEITKIDSKPGRQCFERGVPVVLRRRSRV